MFPHIAQLPDSGSSFRRAPSGWKVAELCVSAAPGALPSMTSSPSVRDAKPRGQKDTGDRAVLGLFQFIKMCYFCLDTGGEGAPGREGNPLDSASSCSWRQWQWFCCLP